MSLSLTWEFEKRERASTWTRERVHENFHLNFDGVYDSSRNHLMRERDMRLKTGERERESKRESLSHHLGHSMCSPHSRSRPSLDRTHQGLLSRFATNESVRQTCSRVRSHHCQRSHSNRHLRRRSHDMHPCVGSRTQGLMSLRVKMQRGREREREREREGGKERV